MKFSKDRRFSVCKEMDKEMSYMGHNNTIKIFIFVKYDANLRAFHQVHRIIYWGAVRNL
jgi:hypothetical protein